jgi:hypothetical protein
VLQSAAAAGISVQQRSLPLAQLQALLLGGSCLLIALVDKVSLLKCEAEDAAASASGSSWLGGERQSQWLFSGAIVAAAAATAAAAAGDEGGSGGGEADSASPAAADVGDLAAAAVCSGTEAAATSAPAASGSKPGGRASEGYLGHYIVVCGYDAGSDQFEIRDPAGSQ